MNATVTTMMKQIIVPEALIIETKSDSDKIGERQHQ